jgi:(R,R)-butanediol dehydrogenase/meso-butanediol dehydrogenase/diacetyl reductase
MRVTNIHAPGDVRLDDLPAPQCGPRDVVITMKACGVCGTDVGLLHMGGLPVPGGRCPLPLGHEPAGEVLEVGAEVRDITAGMRVTFNPSVDVTNSIGCGADQGALSDRVVMRDAQLGVDIFPIPDEIPFEVAALTEPLSVALHAVNRSEATPEQTAVVFGAGPVGVGIVAWLKLRGVRHVVSVDLSPARLELARQLGADETIVGTDDVVARLRELHGTQYVQGQPVAGTDIWFDAAGSQKVFDTIIRGARFQARFIVVAVHHAPVQFDLVALLTKELHITASLAYPTEFGDVAAAMATHWRMFAPMISDRVPIDRVADAIALAGSGQVRGKVMVTF